MTPPTEKGACSCDETLLYDSHRVAPPRWHSCEYIRRRNARLLEVCVEADRAVDGMIDTTPNERLSKLSKRASIISRKMDVIGFEIIREMEQIELPRHSDGAVPPFDSRAV